MHGLLGRYHSFSCVEVSGAVAHRAPYEAIWIIRLWFITDRSYLAYTGRYIYDIWCRNNAHNVVYVLHTYHSTISLDVGCVWVEQKPPPFSVWWGGLTTKFIDKTLFHKYNWIHWEISDRMFAVYIPIYMRWKQPTSNMCTSKLISLSWPMQEYLCKS